MLQIWLALAMFFHQNAPAQPVAVQFARSMTGRNVQVCIDGWEVKTTFAGKLGFRDKTSSWQSVCGAVRSPVAQGQTYAVLPQKSSKVGGNIALAGRIVAKYFKLAQSPDQCAALQLAVWEAVEDGGPHANFGGGRFMAKASGAVLGLAQEMYQAIEEQGDALYLQAGGQGSGGGQSQFTA
jgi:hypothetical protein